MFFLEFYPPFPFALFTWSSLSSFHTISNLGEPLSTLWSWFQCCKKHMNFIPWDTFPFFMARVHFNPIYLNRLPIVTSAFGGHCSLLHFVKERSAVINFYSYLLAHLIICPIDPFAKCNEANIPALDNLVHLLVSVGCWFLSVGWLVRWCFLLRGHSLCRILTTSYGYYSAQNKCKLICLSLLVVRIAVVSPHRSVGFLALASLSLWNKAVFRAYFFISPTHPPTPISLLEYHFFQGVSL